MPLADIVHIARLAAAENAKPLRQRVAEATLEKFLRDERARQADLGEPGRMGGLIHFVRYFWSILEPSTPFAEGKPLEAMILHLEAVTRGEITRLLINVSPGSMKSLLVNVFWPAWEWSAACLPHLRYVSFSYAAHLTERDNGRMRDVLRDWRFKQLWGEAFALTEDGKVRVANDKTGWKFASSVGGVGTGERGDRVLLDDPHNIKEGESEAVRSETVRWFREAMSNRLNNTEVGAIIVIMQRVHEDDVSGTILDPDLHYEYDHLCIPNEFVAARYKVPTSIGWLDWRKEDGELAWPERISAKETLRLKGAVGKYGYTGQYQQDPTPRGGNIFKRDWWHVYHLNDKGKPLLPPYFMVASLDPAYGRKQENDPSGFTCWGLFRDRQGYPKCALLHAWQKHLDLHAVEPDRAPGESNASYIARTRADWGLVQQVEHDCTRMDVDLLLIESKASGISVFQEIRRLYSAKKVKWGVQLIDPGALDKRSRAISVQHLFTDGQIYAPDRDWAEMVIIEAMKFRGVDTDKDNLVDSMTQALRYLRDNGLLLRREERVEEERERAEYKKQLPPLYPEV